MRSKEERRRREGSGGGRLGAAVQRALAMRERRSSAAKDIKGIGAMRDLYISWHNNTSFSGGAACCECGMDCSETVEEEISSSWGGTQSTKYVRFCHEEEGFNTPEHKTTETPAPNVRENREISSVEDPTTRKDSQLQEKSFGSRVSRQLLGFRKKSVAGSIS